MSTKGGTGGKGSSKNTAAAQRNLMIDTNVNGHHTEQTDRIFEERPSLDFENQTMEI